MNDDLAPETSSDADQRGAPTPAIVWLPGTALLCIGAWLVTDGGLSQGWAVGAVGLTLVIIGAVAQGVAWGMDIHMERHP